MSELLSVKRAYYHGYDFHPCMLTIDQILDQVCARENLLTAITVAKSHFPNIAISKMREQYKHWIELGKPTEFIYEDQRHNKTVQKALTEEGELEVVNQILQMNHNQQQVTFQTVRDKSLKQWNQENMINHKTQSFIASDGWIQKFISRHNLSSQMISKHLSQHKQLNANQIALQEKSINDYKTLYRAFVQQYGSENVYNFDETSFADMSGSRTISQKRTVKSRGYPRQKTDQPSVKNFVSSNQRVSIGCIITASGDKLDPIVNVKGKTNRCMNKFNSDGNNRCVITNTESSWFKEKTMFKVLYMIAKHSASKKSLCIWDSYKPHLTNSVIDLANRLNIEILLVPKGLTYKYQPLDFKFNGVFKAMMKSYWLSHRFNEDKEHTCQNIIKTIEQTYYSIKSETIISSFECINY
jgi:hypothetical protein